MGWALLEGLRREIKPGLALPERPPSAFVVDDEAGIRVFISSTLRRAGVSAQAFHSLEDMAGTLPKEQADLIFLDIRLDGSDAVEAIRKLAELRFEGAVQLMSGLDPAQIEAVRRAGEARKLRMLPPLRKPFRASAVLHALQSLQYSSVGSASFAPNPEESTPILLADALRYGWLELWYQPKLNIQRQQIAGAEGLIRVRHPVHGVLPPSSFLPGADEDSLMSLTEFAIISALRDWPTLARSPKHRMQLAVNAPVSVLSKLPIAALIREHAPKTPRWPGLIIEVTEDEVVKDLALVQEIAAQLNLYNVQLSVDDFGAGYSSFSRLLALPFCELKLDRSFVKNCDADNVNSSIAQTVIDLAHRLGKVAVAEGVETGSELRALHQMGCDVGQGFKLARPMPRDRLAGLLLANTTPSAA